jgi:hypothetical protein
MKRTKENIAFIIYDNKNLHHNVKTEDLIVLVEN